MGFLLFSFAVFFAVRCALRCALPVFCAGLKCVLCCGWLRFCAVFFAVFLFFWCSVLRFKLCCFALWFVLLLLCFLAVCTLAVL